MGAVSRDMSRKGREYDGQYPYESEGIAVLLRDVHRVGESCLYDGDIDAVILLVDLKQALDSGCLTPRMRQVVALYYFAQMTEQEVADVLGVTQPAVTYSLEIAIERISTFMEYGYSKPNNAKIDAKITRAYHPFLVWVNDIADGMLPIYSVSDHLTDWLALKGDKKACEALKQRVEGYTYEPIYANDEQKYQALSWEQLRWRDRRVSYFPEIYPQKDVLGFRKVAVKLEDDSSSAQGWSYERRKIFI